ncbi:MAG: hypothetical protein V3V00_15970 [Saprospiraceae bacterium]
MSKPLIDREIKVLIGEVTAESVLIEGFHMSFSITKSDTKEPNTCELNIWNLNVNTRSKLAKLDDFAFVSAGYKKADTTETVFVGNITNVVDRFEPPEIITTISIADGEKVLNSKKVSVSYGKGSKAVQILKDLVSKLGIPLKTNLDKLGIKEIFNTGFSHTGQVKTAIKKVSAFAGLDWSIQNGEIKFTLEDKSDGSILISLNSDSGLIGTPERTKIKDNRRKSKVELDGYKIVSLMQPSVEPQGQIEISSFATGSNKIFKILDVQHDADNREGNFQTTMIVIEAS